MIQRLKSWESPRREGRNNKGKGGAARKRQLKKQQQMLRKKLKDQGTDKNQAKNDQNKKGREINSLPFLFFGPISNLKANYKISSPFSLFPLFSLSSSLLPLSPHRCRFLLKGRLDTFKSTIN